MKTDKRYFIAVASLDHVKAGITGGFAQTNHGKHGPMKRLNKGDKIIYYSSKAEYGKQKPYQKFTAVGEVIDEQPYIGIMSGDFQPYRRNVRYYSCKEASIRSLLEKLSFIQNVKCWGYPFRQGFFEISEQDYETITLIMLHEQE
ncbi:MAG: EVE domain-containing protein [Bacteroidota bacterium]